MNTYHVTLQTNGEIPPQQFFCDAPRPADAIAAAMNQIGPCKNVIASCHLHSPDSQAVIRDFEIVRGRARPF